MNLNMIMTIFAVVLFGTLVLSDNTLITNSTRVTAEYEVTATCYALAQSIIDEAKTKAFDQNTVGVEISDTSSLSTVLGSDVGESITYNDTLTSSGYLSTQRFNDVDDYNNYTRIVRNTSKAGDTLIVRVAYANPANPDAAGWSGRSFCKKMTVTLKSQFIQRATPYSLSYIFTY